MLHHTNDTHSPPIPGRLSRELVTVEETWGPNKPRVYMPLHKVYGGFRGRVAHYGWSTHAGRGQAIQAAGIGAAANKGGKRRLREVGLKLKQVHQLHALPRQ